MGNILYYLIVTGFLGLAYSFWKSYQINGLENGSTKTTEVTASIRKGTMAYIQAEYKFLLLFALSLGILLYFKGKSESESSGFIAISYIVGAGLSALAGYFQSQIALRTNEKVTVQSQNSFEEGFSKAFYGSISIGLIGVSFVIIGISSLLLVFSYLGNDWNPSTILNVMAGFVLGSSSVALFARMGGGVFAKSADISEAYIVKTEPGIKDKSKYNPSSAANDAGQNINNVTGIGSDLYESLSLALIASMILGISFLDTNAIIEHLTYGPILLPLILAAIGIFTTVGASFLLKASEPISSKKAVEISEGFAALIMVIASFFVIKYILPAEWDVERKTNEELLITTYKSLGIFWSAFFGIAASAVIGRLTNIYIGSKTKAINSTVEKSFIGPASNILGGFEQAYISTGIPILLVLAVSIASYYFAGFYGVGIAGVGMLSNMGLQHALNAYASITDNSNSIAIKAGLDEPTIKQTNNLKLIGIELIAKNKGFLVVSATISVLSLLSAFFQQSGIEVVDLTMPLVLAGLIAGVALPFILSSNMLAVVGRVSNKMITETKRQFTEIPALADAKEILDKYNGDLTYATEGEKETVYAAHNSADNKQCIETGAFATIWETLIPAVIAIAIPTLLGYFAGGEILTSLLIGVISGGLIMSIFQATAGSAWESTKNTIEEGVEYKGEIYGKESAAYQAALVGEKVGKPLKDAASPAMIVLMKIMIVVAIILAPALSDKSVKKEGLHVNYKHHNSINKVEKTSIKTMDLNIE